MQGIKKARNCICNLSYKSRAISMFQNTFDFSGETPRDWGIELRYDSNDGERLCHRQRRRLHRPRRLRRKRRRRRRRRGSPVQGNQPGAWNHLIHLEVRLLQWCLDLVDSDLVDCHDLEGYFCCFFGNINGQIIPWFYLVDFFAATDKVH